MLFSLAELQALTGGQWLAEPPTAGAIAGISTDSRNLLADQAFLALHGDRFDGHDFVAAAAENAAVLILDRALYAGPCPVLLVADTLKAYHALARAHRQRFPDLLVVGITGSCGKTSSKEIISSVLVTEFGADAVLRTEGNTNNQIGVPRNLLRLTADHRVAVLEMGTNQPGEIEILTRMVQPTIAIITNVGPVHLERLIDLDGVAREKASIFQGLPPDGLAVIGCELAQNPIVQNALPARTRTIGFDDNADIRIDYGGGDLIQARFSIVTDTGRRLEISWPLHGRHMALNAAAAIAVADELGLADQTVKEGLLSCQLPGMRMEVTESSGVTWINDAYNANPESMRALIRWLSEAPPPSGRQILVLGDMLELGTQAQKLHQTLLEFAQETLPRAAIYAFGPLMTGAARAGVAAFINYDELQQAVCAVLQPGDRIAVKGSRAMALERLLPRPE